MSTRNFLRRVTAAAAGAALVAGAIVGLGPAPAAVAQHASGNAPFINTWLVSGPFSTPVAEEVYGQRPADGNWARVAGAAVSSTWQGSPIGYPGGIAPTPAIAARAIDGTKATEWISQMHNSDGAPSTWPAWDPSPKLTLTWPAPIKVKQIEVFDRHNAAWPANTSDVQRVDYTLKDASDAVLQTGSITSIDPTGQNAGVATLTTAVTNVSKVELLIVHDGQKIMKNVGLGFTEVNVFDGDGSNPPNAPTITPRVGEQFEGKNWEYFDDRVWNRNFDDYQDLYGYYGIKKGVDTRDKFLYAHSYVYSPVARDVEVRVGSSGSHRLFVNDEAVTTASTPAQVQKDMKKQAVHLDAGWNKILLQIEHTFTEDTNANGVPTAADLDVAYLGFYARVSDGSGNKIDDLVYSVSGPDTALAVDTRGLSATDVASNAAGLPSHTLPIAYREWPYVWNTSKLATPPQTAISASHFRFLARGGAPAYTWSISDGALPTGLSLNADGTIDGFAQATPGDYSFAVTVTDSANATASKNFTITVKERPNRWFELGRVSGISHSNITYPWHVDPNFSVDAWAERAKRQGHSLVAVETNQQNYYWPSKFADPQHPSNDYSPKDAQGKLVDGLKPFEEAVKRYGMKFGFYVAIAPSTDRFVQDVEDLISRYDPDYLYFDGPQLNGWNNFDAMFSAVRNHSSEILINSNAWAGQEYGDVDLRTSEASHIYSPTGGSDLTKRAIAEPWKTIVTKNNYTPY